MPQSIQRLVSDSNVHFAHHRDIFSLEYFSFLSKLFEQSSASDQEATVVAPLLLRFIFNIFLRTKKVGRLRSSSLLYMRP